MYEVSSVAGNKLDAAAAIQSVVRPHYSVKNQMMRLLRRSKSAATPPAEKIQSKHNGHQFHHHNHNNNQETRNGGMVVNIVDGLPFVVGGKNKKVIISLVIKKNG